VRRLIPLAPALLAFAVALFVTAAAADDERTVGAYRVTASFASTPVYPLESNGLLIRVTSLAGEPVVGLERSLRLRIGVPNQVTETWNLDPVAGQPGVYKVQLALPRAGTYFMDLFGTIEGQTVNERFVTGAQGLDKVITRGRVYPKGAGIVVLITLGGYLAGLAWLLGRAALQRRRAHRPAPLS
jgi:hypothetical protein